MTILSQKGLLRVYVDIKLTAVNTNVEVEAIHTQLVY